MATAKNPAPEDPAPGSQPVSRLEAQFDGRILMEVPEVIIRAMGLQEGQCVTWSLDPGGRLVLTPEPLGDVECDEGLDAFHPEALWESPQRRGRW